jgi:hypothetical protein
MADVDYATAQELIRECLALEQKLMTAGYLVTRRAMNHVVQQIGYEYAHKIDPANPLTVDSPVDMPIAGESTVRVYDRRTRRVVSKPV